jgi:succinate dehydrogenase/fumarate reductase flavoprotein subunit
VTVYEEFFATKLAIDGGRCAGVLAWDIVRGGLHAIEARHTILATGGMGRMYYGTTNAYACTADGMSLAWRAGVPLKDMEFMQFHPTTLKSNGVLITEGCRGEAGTCATPTASGSWPARRRTPWSSPRVTSSPARSGSRSPRDAASTAACCST